MYVGPEAGTCVSPVYTSWLVSRPTSAPEEDSEFRWTVSMARRFSSSSALWSSPSNTGVPGISSTRARTCRLPIRMLSQPQPPALTGVDGAVVVISPFSARVARAVTNCRIRSRLSPSSPSVPIRLSNASSASVGSSGFTAYVPKAVPRIQGCGVQLRPV
ncbi:hypothetical protein GCM10023238_14660 [Streptomyces heliomycini]